MQTAEITEAAAAKAPGGWMKWAVMAGIAVVALVVAYAPVFSFWWQRWLEPESYYSHAPFVPIASAVLVVMARRNIASLPVSPAGVGLIIMLAAALVGWVGRMTATLSLMGLMLPVYLFGAVVALFGWQWAKALRFPIFFLFFMCVLPEMVVGALSFKTQMASTALSGMLLKSVGFDATVRGAEVVLPHVSVQVGEACSGFRLLISLLAIAVFLAYVRNGPGWRRNLTVAMAIPLGLVINSIRISAIAGVGEFYGRSAVVVVHDWTGWAVLLVAAAVLLRVSKPSESMPHFRHAERVEAGGTQRLSPRLGRNAALVMILTLTWAGTSLAVKPAVLMGRPSASFDPIPAQMDGWVGTNIDATEFATAVRSSSVLMREYRNDSGHRVTLAIVHGYDLEDLHKPEYCLEGSGWQVERKETVSVAGHKAKLLRVSSRESPDLLCLYWFAGPNGSTDEFTARKLDVLRSAVIGRKPEATALVRLTTPVVGGDEETSMRELGQKLDKPVTGLFFLNHEKRN